MFYWNFVEECNKRNISPTAAIIEIGFQRSLGTRWKSGCVPTDANLIKIANYFGVTVEHLLRNPEDSEPTDEPPTIEQKILKALASLSDDSKQRIFDLVCLLKG